MSGVVNVVVLTCLDAFAHQPMGTVVHVVSSLLVSAFLPWTTAAIVRLSPLFEPGCVNAFPISRDGHIQPNFCPRWSMQHAMPTPCRPGGRLRLERAEAVCRRLRDSATE